MSYFTRVYCDNCGLLNMHCSCIKDMQKVDMSDYVPTPIQTIKIGWDDPNEKEYTCANCGGLVGVNGRVYGLVANWCVCGKPSKIRTSNVPNINDMNEIKDLLKQILAKLK